MHPSGNCQFIAFWRSDGGAGNWWQGSNFAPINTASVCSPGWGENYPHSLGPNAHISPYPTRDTDYTTWWFVK